jgi:hypothetical protein
MARKPKWDEGIVIADPDKWYAVAFGAKPFREECCDCGLVHAVHYKVENGKFWVRFMRDEPSTRKARKRMAKQGAKMPTLPAPESVSDS